jgi:adenylate cyclase
MGETRKIAAILVADIVGYSRLPAADEDRTLSRLRGLRGDLIDPAIDAHHGRIVEFRSVVDAVRCATEVQTGMVERNAGLPPEGRIEFRIGIHLGDVVEEADGDLMGDGVNIAARLEGIAQPGEVCLSEDAYRQVREKLKYGFVKLGQRTLKNIARPIGVYALKPGSESAAPGQSASASNTPGPPHFSIVVLPFANMSGDPEQEYFVDGVTESLTADLSRISGSFVIGRNTAFTYKGKPIDLKRIGRELNVRYVLEAAFSASLTGCVSTSNLSTPKAGIIFGRNGSISPWPTFSTCRTKSLRVLRTRSARRSLPPRPAALSGHRTPTPWTSIFKVWLASTRV